MPRRCWIVLSAALAVGCGAKVDADASYKTRGLVQNVEGKAPDMHVTIHHERIESFKDRDGKASPMDSMAMRFALAPGVGTAMMSKGAKLEFDFDVRWSKSDPLLITRATKLPDATELKLTDDH
jgi:Cu/Ag efflux protein CusF